MRASTQRTKKVQHLLYKGNAATRYGVTNEDIARTKYITHMKNRGHPTLDVETCGLFVSIDQPWLAGTPDGLVLPYRLACLKSKIHTLLEQCY